MDIIRKYIIIVILLILSSCLFAQNNLPECVVPYIDKAPVIDGVINDNEWQQAAGFYGFLGADGNICQNEVISKIAWNDDGIYVCFYTKQNSLSRSHLKESHDGTVSSDDAVEIFLMPKDVYYHFISNANDSKYEACGTDIAWDLDWKAVSKVEGNVWNTEIFIPFANNISKPNVGDKWKFNLCRDFKDPVSWTSLSPVNGGFHNPKLFGTLTFGKGAPAIDVSNIEILKAIKSKIRINSYSNAEKNLKLDWVISNIDLSQGLGTGSNNINIKPGFNTSDIELLTPVPPISGKVNNLTYSIISDGNILQKRSINFIPADDISIKIKPNRKEEKVYVDIDTTTLYNKIPDSFTGVVTVSNKNDRIIKSPVFNIANNKTTINMSMKDWIDGKWTLVAEVFDSKNKLVGSKETYINKIDKPDWLNNNIGLDDDVPAPWIPLKLVGNKIECLNRVYDFGKTGFPVAITSQGKNLLGSNGMFFDGASNGKRFKWTTTNTKVIKKSKSTIELLREEKSNNITMSSKVSCDFDGMIRFDVTFKPNTKDVNINKLSLKIPIPKELAKLRYNYAYTFGGGPGFVMPTEKSMIGKLEMPYSIPFMPGVWIGDANKGISWFAEGKKDWNQQIKDKAIEIVEINGDAVLIVNFIDTDTKLNKPVTYTFGIQATPVKPFPRPKDWLTYRPVEMTNNKLFFCGWGGGTKWQGFPVIGDHTLKSGDPKEFDDKSFIEELKTLRARGLTLPMYLNPATAVTDMPELVYYRDEWKNIPEIVTGTDSGQEIILVCARDKNWQDLYIKRLSEFMNKYDVDGTYMDWSYIQRCSNAEHGCGYEKPDGTREPTWPIFAYHELHKRIYKVMKKAKPNSPFVTLAHPVGSMNMPHSNFWDAYVEGEYINVDIRGPKYNNDYTAFYTPERFTAEYNGRNWGSVPLFMAYVTTPAESRTVFAYALMTGAIVWPAYLDWNTQTSTWEALDRFGVDNITEFLPYWDNKGAVKWTGNDKTFITTYKNKTKSLLVVSNLDARETDVDININPKVLKLGSKYVIRDAYTREVIGGTSNLKVKVPAKDFKLLVIE